jgi:hypothetical protein
VPLRTCGDRQIQRTSQGITPKTASIPILNTRNKTHARYHRTVLRWSYCSPLRVNMTTTL